MDVDIERAARTLAEAAGSPVRVILFGSHARGDAHDVADALLAKAAGDEAGLRALVDNYDVPDHVAGFLAQQGVEKALKAVLRSSPFGSGRPRRSV